MGAINVEKLMQIRQEVLDTQMLVSPKKESSRLLQEYDAVKSPEYHSKAKEVIAKFSHIRPIRGDGSCFYRAFIVAYLEKNFNNRDELLRFKAAIDHWKGQLKNLGYGDYVEEDLCTAMRRLVDSILDKTRGPNEFFAMMNDVYYAAYYIALLRHLCSAFLVVNQHLYMPFLPDEYNTMEDFVAEEIETVNREVDHLGITALVNAMAIPIRIEYMDRGARLQHIDFKPDDMPDAEPHILLLYRPGHYEILYKAGEGIGEDFEDTIKHPDSQLQQAVARSLSTIEVTVSHSDDQSQQTARPDDSTPTKKKTL